MSSDGEDATDAPIVLSATDAHVSIVFTDRPTDISGFVRDDAGRPAPNATVYAFPVDERLWHGENPMVHRTMESRPSGSGYFRLSGLVPGNYWIGASTADVPDEWRTDAVLRSLAGAAKQVRVAYGEPIALDLKVAR